MNLGFNDSNRSQSLKGFLLPSLPEVILLVLVSLLLLMALSHNAIWMAASSDAGVSGQAASEATQPQLEAVSNFLSQEVFARATVFLLWGCIGAVAYTVVGAVLHFAQNVKGDVNASKFITPQSANNYWLKRTSQYLYVIAIIFLFGLFVGVFLSAILPLCVEAMSTTILDYKNITGYGHAVLSLGITTVCLYALVRLYKATVYSFKVTFISE